MAHFNILCRVEVIPPFGMEVITSKYSKVIMEQVQSALDSKGIKYESLKVKRGGPPRPDVSARAKKKPSNV